MTTLRSWIVMSWIMLPGVMVGGGLLLNRLTVGNPVVTLSGGVLIVVALIVLVYGLIRAQRSITGDHL
jgi:hypothetical protein